MRRGLSGKAGVETFLSWYSLLDSMPLDVREDVDTLLACGYRKKNIMHNIEVTPL